MTLLRDDSHRTGMSDTPVCACGLERETAEHYLLYCSRFEEARNRLKDALLDISDLSGRRKQLYVCLKLCCWHLRVTLLQEKKRSL